MVGYRRLGRLPSHCTGYAGCKVPRDRFSACGPSSSACRGDQDLGGTKIGREGVEMGTIKAMGLATHPNPATLVIALLIFLIVIRHSRDHAHRQLDGGI